MATEMSSAVPVAPLRGTITLREANGRIWVRWRLRGGNRTEAEAWFREMRTDFRAMFPRHRDACYSHVRRSWSVPARHREKLGEWIAAWRLEIVEEAPA